jgi:hypothetical protein
MPGSRERALTWIGLDRFCAQTCERLRVDLNQQPGAAARHN